MSRSASGNRSGVASALRASITVTLYPTSVAKRHSEMATWVAPTITREGEGRIASTNTCACPSCHGRRQDLRPTRPQKLVPCFGYFHIERPGLQTRPPGRLLRIGQLAAKQGRRGQSDGVDDFLLFFHGAAQGLPFVT